MAVAAPDDALLDALRRHFGHREFRPGQRDVVEAVVAGDDAVVVMPTGGGKSLCYQLPALLGGGTTVVVSPLIALMKDQVDALRARGIAAAALHSNVDRSEQAAVRQEYRAGMLRLLYVAPERLVVPEMRSMLTQTRPVRIVVDEAHCISEWGHDFRHDYLRIGDIAAELGPPLQLVACTATATPEVRDDIVARLAMRRPRSFVHGFARPNLHLAVERVRSEEEKIARLEAVIDPGDGHAIVYAGTRARAAALAQRLGQRFPTMLYHGDLSAEQRSRAQERFASGEVRIAVTTSAFGMGVDIPTVRQVVHVALPASLEEYYQQAGRAGRDGLDARCIVIHAPNDRRLQEFFIDAAHPDRSTLAGVHRSLLAFGSDPGSWSLVTTRERGLERLSDAAGDAARECLRSNGLIDSAGRVRDLSSHDLPVDHDAIAAHRRQAYRRLERLLAYLSTRSCRHLAITAHFGEDLPDETCGGRCDICEQGPTATGPVVDGISVRKALSAVARLNDRLGVARIAGVLVGSRSRTVLSVPGVDRLPTYGALAGWREADVVELLRRLLDAGALRQSAPPYATVSLTDRGVAAMRGEVVLDIADPRPDRRGQAATTAPVDALGPDARERFELLRAWRTDRARALGVPAYIVFHDRTLAALAQSPPRTMDQLLTVSGVGPGKAALHGQELLAVLADAGQHQPFLAAAGDAPS